jgi:hypothetical protein
MNLLEKLVGDHECELKRRSVLDLVGGRQRH